MGREEMEEYKGWREGEEREGRDADFPLQELSIPPQCRGE
jgi:hypothetical protein